MPNPRKALLPITALLFALICGESAFIVAREAFQASGQVAMVWAAGTFITMATFVTSPMSKLGAFDRPAGTPQDTS
ncbi:hypothetical protein [Streptosporangium sp. NPDC002524]|uniref:hypothetical protein n=1 Tax=Streptosporangium sp. NPDC002524 TaxID=3154537 RepID=UPI00332813EC